ncbi:MAG: dockerin type I domain-containing protein, partial [Anaerolineae bacterium]
VPYTPLPQTPLSAVLLAAAGPQPQTVTLTVGSAVQWLAEVDGLAPPEVLMQQNENPSLHPLSALNPISNTLGWDGGMMAPGRIYERQMSDVGLFTYTDGLGHTGQVCVSYVEDVNRDGVVDLLDLQAVASAWGTVNPTLDMDQDGDVDIVDVMLVTRRWGWSCQA